MPRQNFVVRLAIYIDRSCHIFGKTQTRGESRGGAGGSGSGSGGQSNYPGDRQSPSNPALSPENDDGHDNYANVGYNLGNGAPGNDAY